MALGSVVPSSPLKQFNKELSNPDAYDKINVNWTKIPLILLILQLSMHVMCLNGTPMIKPIDLQWAVCGLWEISHWKVEQGLLKYNHWNRCCLQLFSSPCIGVRFNVIEPTKWHRLYIFLLNLCLWKNLMCSKNTRAKGHGGFYCNADDYSTK